LAQLAVKPVTLFKRALEREIAWARKEVHLFLNAGGMSISRSYAVSYYYPFRGCYAVGLSPIVTFLLQVNKKIVIFWEI